MQLVYNGPHPEVVVDELDPQTVILAGQPVEIPDDLAARLLEQSTWAAADKKAEKVQAQIDKAVADVAAQSPVPAPVPDGPPTDSAPDGTADTADTSTSATSTKGNS